MAKIIIHPEKISDIQAVIALCPFSAIEQTTEGQIQINAACKVCKICVTKGPSGAFEYVEEKAPEIDKSLWKGVTVYVEHHEGEIHPVTYELLGKAKELAAKINHPVYALFIGGDIEKKAEILFHYGADQVFVYDSQQLTQFRIEPYAAAFSDFINKYKPSTILVGGTTIGRSLAPRVAARFKTGLTADCTVLDMQVTTDLDQIRPAFGGNIMAHIRTPNSRPQFATVRYKIFNPLAGCEIPEDAKVTVCSLEGVDLSSKIQVLAQNPKKSEKGIEDAEVLVVGGRGLKKPEDLVLIKDLAAALGGQYATSRPLVEAGWSNARNQVGLSGRTVKPKLIITCGVSGSIQFRAGMQNSEYIIAINSDENAPIFSVAHVAIIGDLYQIVPEMINKIKNYKKEKCEA
jgi:electron transfer flavoprotein alpha subunit